MPPRTAPVTLAELWQLALPAGTRLVAGRAGLERGVTWVASLSSTVPLFGTIEPGYLAFADIEVAQRIDPRITFAYLARGLIRAGVVGLVLTQEPSVADRQLADELPLPLLVLPDGADLAASERNVLRALVDREGQIARREIEAHQALEAALGRGDLDALVRKLVALARAQAVIHDARGDQLAAAMHPDVPSDENASPPSSITIPIRLAGRRLGNLVLWGFGIGDTLARIYAQQAAELSAGELLQRHVRRETEERLSAEIIEDLLDATSPDDPLLSRLARQGYRIAAGQSQAAVALAASLPLTHDHGSPSAATLQVATSLQRAAERDGATVLLTTYRNATIALLATQGQQLDDRLRYWLSVAVPLESQEPICHVGVSRVAPGDLDGLRAATQQALDALFLGYRSGSLASPYLHGELGLYRLLAAFHGQAEVTRFVEETIGPLIQYDREHSTELVRTIEAYLHEHGNNSRAAQALFIHRNTLANRLERIAEVLRVDLDDPETLLAVHLALKLHALRPS
jgi:PucR family transcriptional regulator, purine catabolism regulatory protein